MTETSRDFVLRRKLEAAAPDPAFAVAGLPSIEKALGLSMARVSDKLMELVVATKTCVQVTRSLAELLDELPENGLYAVLEGPQEAQGVMVLDNALLGALIEQQTAGALGTSASATRKPTRTDAALCADWIDSVLAALEEPFTESAQASWLSGFGFSCHLPDSRPLGLMLEDEPYRVLSFTLDLGTGAREGTGKLILPAKGRALEGRPVRTDGADAVRVPDSLSNWERRIEAQVMDAEVTLRAVLHRSERTIEQILQMSVGDLLAIPESAIKGLRLEASDGTVIAMGRLGQSSGLRAVRLIDGEDQDDAAQEDLLGVAMAMSEEDDPAGSDELANLEGVSDLGNMPELPDLPDIGELAGDTARRLPDLADLPDGLPDLLAGGAAREDGVPSIDIADLTGT